MPLWCTNTKQLREADNARCSQDFRINQCKGYIFSHLHVKLSTSDIAAAMHMSPNYLSNLFKKNQTGGKYADVFPLFLQYHF